MVLHAAQVAGLTAAALAVGAALGFLAAQRRHHHQQPTTNDTTQRKRCGFPKRIILVRHGESEGNIDPLLYCHVPDNAMHLTDLGYEQAVAAGQSIKQIVGDESVRFIVSPYVRTIETFHGLKQAWPKVAARAMPWSEEPRIREQDFGNFQDPLQIRECKAQRRRFGSFFYRFPSGESPADVFDRVSSFLESLHRLFDKTAERNYVLVTHGVAIRVILTRYFKYRISEFEQMANFTNGEFAVLEYDAALHKYALATVVRNDVTVVVDPTDATRRVHVTTHASKTIRMHEEDAFLSPTSRPYPTSPINHFRRSSSTSVPAMALTPVVVNDQSTESQMPRGSVLPPSPSPQPPSSSSDASVVRPPAVEEEGEHNEAEAEAPPEVDCPVPTTTSANAVQERKSAKQSDELLSSGVVSSIRA